MAVDYYHHLVVSGPRASVTDFVDRISLVVSRRVAGVTDHSVVPFSLKSLYAIAGIKDDVPYDPYDMVRWRRVSRGNGQSEVRYRFHTRNLEMHPLLRRLSKRLPKLRFAQVTVCLDDMDFAPFVIQNGKMRGNWLGGDWRTPFWERAARKSRIDLEEAYEDDDLEVLVHAWMLDAAVRIATGSNRRYRWGGGRVFRDLFDEQANVINEIADALKAREFDEKREREIRRGRGRPREKR